MDKPHPFLASTVLAAVAACARPDPPPPRLLPPIICNDLRADVERVLAGGICVNTSDALSKECGEVEPGNVQISDTIYSMHYMRVILLDSDQ